MKSILSLTLLLVCSFAVQAQAVDFTGEPPAWAYDEGPNPNTEMGKELIELNARIPYFPGISYELLGEQKFRAPFGPISWRMLQKPNSVKILFIGQDGTHIAEAAGRPATAGFGGRAHDLANYFGVDYSAGFINTYAFTIYGQYGDYGVPYVYENNSGSEIRFSPTYLDNELWLMSQSQQSPITQWRNDLIEWIIRNNKDSLKMIVTFGGSAKDSISSFIISRGGDVGTRYSEDYMKNVRMPEFISQSAGGNYSFPAPINVYGDDLYQKYFAQELAQAKYIKFNDRVCKRSEDFKWFKNNNPGMSENEAYDKFKEQLLEDVLRYKTFPIYAQQYRDCDPLDQQDIVQDLLAEKAELVKKDMVFTNGGRHASGFLHPAQLGGFDPEKIEINGKKTISLKGLALSDGSKVTQELLVVDLPHPTNLSTIMNSQGPEVVSQRVNEKLEIIRPYVQNGWEIECDEGSFLACKNKKSPFTQNKKFEYGRGEIGQEYYDFGTPGNRMVSQSDAKRLSSNVILLGARNDPYFDQHKRDPQLKALLDDMINAKPATYPSKDEMYIAISRTPEEVTNFDPGPGIEFAKLMKDNLDVEAISKYKSGMSWKDSGNKATNIKSHPSVKDFGHYRGTFDKPSIVILADPMGWDDLITARALTGTRGQYLQGLMEDAGVAENYLVFKTVPFGMDGATQEEWNVVLRQTEKYRNEVLKAVLAQGGTQLVMTDGLYAKAALDKFLKDNSTFASIERVDILRSHDMSSDMIAAGRSMAETKSFKGTSPSGKMANIPGKHLSYYARVWEGTSGDRVITAKGITAGLAFAEVVPDWAARQKVSLEPSSQQAVDSLKLELCKAGLPLPGEKPSDFVDRQERSNFPSCNGF